MNSQTLELTIPVELKQAIQKIVDKTQKCVKGISLSFGKDYLKAYTHTFAHYGENGNQYAEKDVRMHEMCDMVLVTPTSDWNLKCSYEDGLMMVADLKKELVIKNPTHGKDYRKCDCCKHHISKYSYIIENTKTGEELQVGKECLKKYTLESLAKLYRMVADALGLVRFEVRDLGFGSGEMDLCDYPYRDTNAGKQSKLVREMIRAAKAFYDENNGEWESGGYINGRYYKSTSGERLQNFACDTKNYSHITEEYAADVLTFVKDVIGEKVAKADIYDYEFERDMVYYLDNVYIPLCLCHHAFFAVKKYEKHLERERQRLEMEKLGKLEVGQQLHIKGEVISHNTYEGYYGSYDVYEVRSEKGYTLRRKGVIPVGKDKKSTEFYAQVLGISSNGVVSLDRATKNPKKGIQYITI